MKKTRRTLLAAITAVCVTAILATGCRKDLYYEEGGDTHKVQINITWPSGITSPEGARAIFYPLGGGTPLIYNLSPSGGEVSVPAGRYNVVLFNNDTEYVKLYNDGKDSTLEARTTALVKATKGTAFPSEDIVNMPDMFYSCKADSFNVTAGTSDDVLNASPVARVKSFRVRVFVSGTAGMSGVSSAEGYISNAYGSYFPGMEKYPAAGAIIPFGFSDMESDHMDAPVRTFGVLPSSAGNIQMLRLAVTLTDGTVSTYEYDITGQLNVDLSKGDVVVTIPDKIDISPSGTTPSGFNVTVKGWGDATNVEL